MKIAIIGSGISGLASSIMLSKAGHTVEVFERAPEIKEVGAGLSLWPNATYALEAMGVLDTCLQNSCPFERLRILGVDGKRLMEVPALGYGTPTIAMHRADLVFALTTKVSPSFLRLGQEITSVSESQEGALLFAGTNKFGPFDLVVGADGLRSVARTYVRQQPADELKYHGYPVWRGIAPFEYAQHGSISETWGAGQRFGILSIGKGRTYWYATQNQTLQEANRDEDHREHLLKIFGSWHSPIPEILERTPASAILKNLTYDRLPMRGWSRGRVVLIGDAAHAATPNLGQGGCMALEDAMVLPRALNSTGNLTDALQKFERTRFSRTAGIVKKSRRIGFIEQWENRLAVFARNSLCSLLPGRLVARANRNIYEFKSLYLGQADLQM
jgi:2-polyprenyl-6-methoxyphenol hydroxylase-like FAD-dependent oxidoreductase